MLLKQLKKKEPTQLSHSSRPLLWAPLVSVHFQFILLTLLSYAAILVLLHFSDSLLSWILSQFAPLSFLHLKVFFCLFVFYSISRHIKENLQTKSMIFFPNFKWNVFSQINQFNVRLFLFHFCAAASAFPGQTHPTLTNLRSHQISALHTTGELHQGVPRLEFPSRKGKLNILHLLSSWQ